MSTIADKITELRMIEREQREFLTIPDGVPFKDYINFIWWAPPRQKLYLDFANQRYGMDGEKCTLQDVFDAGLLDFTRLSKAWQFEQGTLKEYDVNEPRFIGKGLLIEGEVTNYLNLSNFRNDNIYRSEVSDGVVVVESLTDRASSLSVLNTAHPTPAVTGDDVYRLIIAETPKDTMIGLGGTTGTSSIITKDGERVDSFNVSNGWASYEGGVHRMVRTDTVSTRQRNISFCFGSKTGSDGLPTPLIGEKMRVIAATATTEAARIKDFSPIGMSKSADTTRLPETLTVLTDSDFTIEADEGIQVNGNEITGFGYIRKLEVK